MICVSPDSVPYQWKANLQQNKTLKFMQASRRDKKRTEREWYFRRTSKAACRWVSQMDKSIKQLCSAWHLMSDSCLQDLHSLIPTQHRNSGSQSLFPTESINSFYFFHCSWGFCQPWAHCCLCRKIIPPCYFNTHHCASGAPDSHDALITLLGWRGVVMAISREKCNTHSPNSANHPTGDNRN